MTRRIAVLVVVLALTCGAAAMGGAAATLGVSSRSIDTFTAALPASTSTTSGDSVAPTLVALEMFDTNANGKVDQVKATFNEALAAYTAGTTPWTLANVPSGGTLSAVAVSGSIATLTIAEGGGAANTAVGTFTVALAQSTTGIRDAAGNRSSFAATAPADKAPAVLVSVTDSDTSSNADNGRIQKDDHVDFTFSEALQAATIPTSSTLEAYDVEGAGNDADVIRITGVLAGNNPLGGIDYLDKNNRQVSFTATVGLQASTTIRVTLTGNCSGNCGDLNTSSGTATFTFVSSITGTDGLAVLGGSFSIAFM